MIKYHGVTKDPKTKEYMLVMNYASGGNLHNHLQKNFTNIHGIRKYIFYGKFQKGNYILNAFININL